MAVDNQRDLCIRAKARDLIKLGETEWPEIVLNRDDDTPLHVNIKGQKLAEVCRLNPNDLVGHTEQTFMLAFLGLDAETH